MDMHEVVEAIEDAQLTLRKADRVAGNLVKLLVGRLRSAGSSWEIRKTLADLKRELRDYNATTLRWKKKQ